MKIFSAIFVLGISLVFVGSSVAEVGLNSLQLKAADYLLKKADQENLEKNRSEKPICDDKPSPPTTACIQYVGGNYPNTDERIRAARACTGVTNIDCVKYVAGSYPNFIERENSAVSCRSVTDLKCAQYVAGNYASINERTQAVQACLYANVECVKEVAGSYPTFAEKIAAAKACSGL